MPDVNPGARRTRGRKRAADKDFVDLVSSDGEVEHAVSRRARKTSRGSSPSSSLDHSVDTASWNFEHHGVDSKLLNELEAQLTIKPADEEKIYQTVSTDVREELLGSLVRYLLLRSARKLPITRQDVNKDVMGNFRGFRGLLNHLLLGADKYLRKVFGYQVVLGSWVDDKISGTLYLNNSIAEVGEEAGAAAMEHLADVQSGAGHRSEVAARALLMATLALALHGGDDGVAQEVLVNYLRQVDSRVSLTKGASSKISADLHISFKELLDKWTKEKYLVKERKDFHGDLADFYCVGPRALVEVGRPGILSFVYGVQGYSVDEKTLEAMRDEDEDQAEDP